MSWKKLLESVSESLNDLIRLRNELLRMAPGASNLGMIDNGKTIIEKQCDPCRLGRLWCAICNAHRGKKGVFQSPIDR